MDENTKKLDDISKQAGALRESIAQVTAQFPGAGNHLFRDLMGALDLFESRKNLWPELFSDAKVRPSRQEVRIRNAEQNLQRQKALLAEVKKRKALSLRNPGKSETISVEAVDQAIERVRLAEMQLSRAKGEQQNYVNTQKAKIAEEIATEKAEYERSVTDWQQGWRNQDWQNPGWMPKKN